MNFTLYDKLRNLKNSLLLEISMFGHISYITTLVNASQTDSKSKVQMSGAFEDRRQKFHRLYWFAEQMRILILLGCPWELHISKVKHSTFLWINGKCNCKINCYLYFFEYNLESVRRWWIVEGYFPLQSMKVSSNGNNYPPDVPPLFSPFLFSRGSKITSTQAQAHCSLQNKRTK